MFKWFSKQQPANESEFKLSDRSRRNLYGVHPLLVDLVKKTIKESSVDFGIIDNGGLRTAEMQYELFKKGASKLDGYEKISKHQIQPSGYGEAVDLVPYIGGSYRWEMQPCLKIANAMKMIWKYTNQDFNIVWGGSWRPLKINESSKVQYERYLQTGGKFPDGPHFELRWK